MLQYEASNMVSHVLHTWLASQILGFAKKNASKRWTTVSATRLPLPSDR